MLFTTAISLLVVIMAYISQFKKKGKYFEIGFLILTIIAAIQYYYGTDYMRYYELWDMRYASKDVKDLLENFFEQTDWTEPGWMLLNAIFGFKYGFYCLVALISVVENLIYYCFIKDYVPAKWRWLAVFLYVFMDNLYLLNFSMFRQGLCVALFVAAVMLMNKRKLVPAIAVIIFSLTIHLSAAVCVPFIVLYFSPLKKTNTIAVALLIFTFVIFVFKDVVVSGIKLAFEFEELGKYAGYGRKQLGGIGLGYVLIHIPNIVILYALLTDKIKTREQKVVAFLAFCDVLITPLQFYGADMAGRLGVFFMVFRLGAIPYVYGSIKEQRVKAVLVLLLIATTMLLYYQFFQIYSSEGYMEYRTIFSVL